MSGFILAFASAALASATLPYIVLVSVRPAGTALGNAYVTVTSDELATAEQQRQQTACAAGSAEHDECDEGKCELHLVWRTMGRE